MRDVSRRSLLGLRVQDCHGQEIGRVVDTWPDDGGWELEFVVIRLPRFGERRMLPADRVVTAGGVVRAAFSRRQIEDAPTVNGGRHGADDPYRAKSYWMFEEPRGAGIVTPRWRRSSGFSATARPYPTSPSRTPTGS
ncbi:MAG: PRC-barrel domain-containing protein [Solirubrobacteraceae bacterium]